MTAPHSSNDLAEIKQVMKEADCLFPQSAVDAALAKMATEITARLADANPLVYVIMNGGLFMAGQLLPKLLFPLEVSYLHVSRYGHALNGTYLDWRVRPTHDLRDRTVLVLDDILDEGYTLVAVMDYLREQGADDVLCAALVDKRHERKARPGLRPDFYGLEVEDRFLFGCGMDYKGYWRNAPGIYALKGH